MVNEWFISRFWRLYRQNRRMYAQNRNLYRLIREMITQNETAWEVGAGNVRLLGRRNADLRRRLEESEKRCEALAVRVMAQGYLLRDGGKP